MIEQTILQNHFGNSSVSTEGEFFPQAYAGKEMETHNRFINDPDGGINSTLVNLLIKFDGEVSGHA